MQMVSLSNSVILVKYEKYHHLSLSCANFGGSVGCRSIKNSFPSADSRRAVISLWWKKVHNTGLPLRLNGSLPSNSVFR